jgi:putative DNA methylase
MVRASASTASLLDRAEIPVAELSARAAREGKRQQPIYGAHKWFARRAGSAFRALILGSVVDSEEDFWKAFTDGRDLAGTTILDPFVGGGTSVVEGRSLGADVVGVDIDPIACAVSSFELRADSCPPLASHLDGLKEKAREALGDLYVTEVDGRCRVVLHFFWVQVLDCGGCGTEIEAHPSYRLAHDDKQAVQWVFCSRCHEPSKLSSSRKRLQCDHCEARTTIENGTVKRGSCRCPACGAEEALIDVASRTKGPPLYRLFAMEVLPADWAGARVPIAEREFIAAGKADEERVDVAEGRLKDLGELRLDDEIPKEDRSDDRLLRYGYERYRDLFNPRQMLHLRSLATAIEETRDPNVREALSLAFSDHLTTNCMLTCYAAGWRRLVPLFAVRAFRHIPRPVEINPWLSGTGRGTFPNAVRQVSLATQAAREAYPAVGGSRILNGSSTNLDRIAANSVDLVLTDPPYFDYVDYSELADFFRPWLAELGLIEGASDRRLGLASKGRDEDAADLFAERLGDVFSEIQRVLKPDGRLAFTFRHRSDKGWAAVGKALKRAPRLRCVNAFPLLAEGTNRLHTHDNTIVWDAVLVFALSEDESPAPDPQARSKASNRARRWKRSLEDGHCSIPFKDPDLENLERALRLAFGHGGG